MFKGKLCYTEESNSYPNSGFNSQSNVSQLKLVDKSLSEIIENNLEIYDVYKQKGDYRGLLEEKKKNEEEAMRIQNKSEDLNISDEVNLDNRNRDEEEEIPDRENIRNELFGSTNFEADDDLTEYQHQEDESHYSDNNYWNTSQTTNEANDDMIDELLR